MNTIDSSTEIRREADLLSSSVLRVLLYYDLFNYPLTIDEIARYCNQPHSAPAKIQDCLGQLCSEGIIFSYDNFYSLKEDRGLFERRLKGNHEAQKIMSKARKRSAFISKFPFVRGVCISGSLSKNYFDETTDIDFFIITGPNRLWLCRSLLILYKKIFLLNSKKYFCVNYFIDSENLEIPDKNIFTATEIITLLPCYNMELYEKFFEKNDWVKRFYPNSSLQKNPLQLPPGTPWVKTILERLFSTPFGSRLDQYFFRITHNHWRKRFPSLPAEEFEVNMRSKKDVSKHHPQGFQFRILKLLEENCRAFEKEHQLILH